MAEEEDLLEAIASIMIDYREGDLGAPDAEHVHRWIDQFPQPAKLPILREMRHVLGKTYLTREWTKSFLTALFSNQKLVGDDPCAFWREVQFLNIQGGGGSQKEMLALFESVLKKECGVLIEDCGKSAETFVYLDDGIFTGNRVLRDLQEWIKGLAPSKARVNIVSIALHNGGQFYAHGRLVSASKAAGKEIEFSWWRAVELEDRKAYTDTSDVLRPVAVPADPDVQAYVAGMRYPPHLRTPGQVGGLGIFSSDAGRQVLEQEFLKAGVGIRNLCPHLGVTQRPLGHMTLDTLGFGSLIVTFRNCPNNAPLALWAGDPWYPLFPRTTNSQTSLQRFIALLTREKR
jgi:hypothetical protein